MPSATRFEPDWASPPGNTVATILEERAISTDEFSRMLAKSPEAVHQLLEGRLEICDELAEQLSQVIFLRAVKPQRQCDLVVPVFNCSSPALMSHRYPTQSARNCEET